MFFPYTLLPDFVIWLYANGMWIAEPLFLCVESYQVVISIRASGQWLSDLVYERDIFGKAAVLSITGFAYLLSFTLLTYACSSYTFPLIWSLLICGVYVAVLIGFAIYHEYGIISDSALVTLLVSLVLYAASKEAGSFDILDSDPSRSTEKSYFHQLLELPLITTGNNSKSLPLVRELCSSTTWMLLAVRVTSVVSFLVQYLPQQSSDEDSGYRDNDTGSGFRFTFVNLTAVFLYSQTVVKRLSAPSLYIATGRYLQAIGVSIFYVVSLVNQEDVWQ